MRKAGCFDIVELEGRAETFSKKLCRFASKFHSVLGQEFFKSVPNYVEVHFRY